ncbi:MULTISPECIES: hypothetical protein [Roseomonadaceae]|uniref:Protamine-2 (Modular protein) n=1 Tax=Falsiroseomonas oleicola TaxID=2801474 RepID=A0ABS6H8W8_9PROT|nr:hypothetical protein [Roseomonas oleicola]MBU8545169.1 hypothetical protein [Roseomonas oleicola]
MERRRFLFAGLAGALAATLGGVAAQAATPVIRPAVTPEPQPAAEPALAREEEVDALMQEVQWGPPPGRPRPGRGPRRRRCWTERRRVAYRDRFGRVRYRMVDRRVCR